MEFINDTWLPAALYRSQIEMGDRVDLPDWKPGQPPPWIDADPLPAPPKDEVMLNVLTVRCRYPLDESGALGAPVAQIQRETLEPDEPDDSPYGHPLEPGIFPRAGTDLIVMGDAVVRAGEAHIVHVRIACGPYDLTLKVFGDRVWTPTLRGLVPGPPAPFRRMPITWGNAFGGKAEGEYGPLPYPANPEGKGYYLTRDAAEGRPLPNIEDAAAPIGAWSDNPEPVGCGPYPSNWALRLQRCMDLDVAAGKMALRPERGLFDSAHPRLSGQRIKGGLVTILGMTAGGRVAFAVPPCPAVADILVGERSGTRTLQLDEILVDLRRGLVDLTWTKRFKYLFVPNLIRRTTVRFSTGV